MKITVLDCNDPWVCRSYHTMTESDCCKSGLFQLMEYQGRVIDADRAKKLSPKQMMSTRQLMRCKSCKKPCKWTNRHR